MQELTNLPRFSFSLCEMHFSVHKTFLLNTLPLLDAVCLFVCFFSLLSYILAQKILLEWKTLMFAICFKHWSWYTYKFTNIIESCSCTLTSYQLQFHFLWNFIIWCIIRKCLLLLYLRSNEVLSQEIGWLYVHNFLIMQI